MTRHGMRQARQFRIAVRTFEILNPPQSADWSARVYETQSTLNRLNTHSEDYVQAQNKFLTGQIVILNS